MDQICEVCGGRGINEVMITSIAAERLSIVALLPNYGDWIQERIDSTSVQVI